MEQDIEKVLVPRQHIASRLDELAEMIIADLNREAARVTSGGAASGGAASGGLEITLVPILTGSIIFVSDLIRRLPIRMQIRVMSVTSYPGKSTASRGASVEAALTRIPESLAGRHVLVIDDILDSGNTLRACLGLLRERNPASLKSCVLLRKQRPEAMSFPVDYVAFDIPDEFVVGYGLDFDDYYRNLPEIVTLKPDVVAKV